MKKLLSLLFIACLFILTAKAEEQSFKFKSNNTKLKFATNNAVASGLITISPALSGGTSTITINEGDEYNILAGQEYTVTGNFTKLDLYENQLTSLDVSGLQSLKELRCAKNKLETLDASKLSSLTYLSCWENEISNLNVSGCTNLETLNCSKNELSSLDLSNLTNLSTLYCNDNQLIDIKGLSKYIPTFNGANQSATIAMKPNGEGEFISVKKYSLAKGHILNITLPVGTRFENGYFINTANFPSEEIDFSTTIGWGDEKNLKGKLKFVKQPISASVPVKITLKEKDLEAGLFDSGLFKENETEAFASATNDSTGTITIDIVNLPEGVYSYTLKQISDKKELYNYDTKEYTVVVTVAVNSDNALASTVVIKDGETSVPTAEFTNTYIPPTSFKFKSSGTLFLIRTDHTSVEGGITIEPAVSQTTGGGTTENISKIIPGSSYTILADKEYTVSGNFTELNLMLNKLYHLDLSKLTKLSSLFCRNNQLSSLDLPNLTNLTYLDCTSNQLSSLDVSKVTGLKTLVCSYNKLSYLDLSKVTNLIHLYCGFNQLIDIKGISKPISDFSGNNQSITIAMKPNGESGFISVKKYSLDLGDRLNTDIPDGISFENGYFISIADFPSEEIAFSTRISLGDENKLKGQLKFLEQPISASVPVKITLKGKDLEAGKFDSGLFKENETEAFASATNDTTGTITIDIVNLPEGEYSYTLKQISDKKGVYNYDTKEYAVKVTVALNLESALVSTVEIKDGETIVPTADFTNTYIPPGSFKFKSKGTEFWIHSYNTDVEGDITIEPAVSSISGENTSIIVAKESYLISPNEEYTITGYFSSLNLSNNQLSNLDLSKLTNLEILDCYNNQLSNLDLSNLTNLKGLSCGDNQLTNLDLSKLTKLGYLDCRKLQLSSLDLSKLTNLEMLYCHENQLIDIKAASGSIDKFYGADQSPTIAMKPNVASGFISVNEYSLEPGHKLSIDLTAGISFENGRFISTAHFPSEEIDFSTEIGLGDDVKLNGKLKFVPTINASVPIIVTLKDKALENDQFKFGLFKENETEALASATNDATGSCVIKIEDLTVGTYTYILKQHNNKQAGYTYDSKEYTVEVTVALKSANTLKATVVIKEGETSVTTAEFKNTYTPPGSFKFKSSRTFFSIISAGTSVEGAITIDPAVSQTTEGETTENISKIVPGSSYTILADTEYTVSGNFTNLNLTSNKLSSLELSNLTNLKELRCNDNLLSSLDLSNLTNLTRLDYSSNQLSSLDLSNLTDLKILGCLNNQITSLDLSNLTKLSTLDCGSNQLSSLDLSNLTNLEYLYCYKNQLIDIKGASGSINIFSGENQSITIEMKANGASGFISVKKYSLAKGHILNVDLPVGTSFENGYFINTADFPSEEIAFSTELGLGDEKKLEGQLEFVKQPISASVPVKITLKGKDLEAGQFDSGLFKENETEAFASATNDTTGTITIDIVNLPEGEYTYTLKQISEKKVVYNYDTKEYTVKVTVDLNYDNTLKATVEIKDGETIVPTAEFKNTYTPPGSFKFISEGALFRIHPEYTDVEGDITIEPAVSSISGENTSIIVAEETYLISPNEEYTITGYFSSLNLSNNQLTNLDLSKLTKLKELICGDNQLTNLELSKLTKLGHLDCRNNQLASLDLSKLTNLEILDCYNNQLSNLDLSNLTNLKELSCGDNQLTNLDLSKLTNLKELICGDNQLTNLELSKLTKLGHLDCRNNQLASLDLSKLTNLSTLYCHENQLIDIKAASGSINDFYGVRQSITIAMKPNGTSGFISVNEYSIEPGHKLSIDLTAGISFENGRFISTAHFPSEEIDFSTEIGLGDDVKLNGKLKFVPTINANVPIIVTLKDKALENDQFKFGLFKENATEAFVSTTNDATGSCVIKIENLTEGTYTYILKQHNTEQEGYTYDTKEYTVEVTVALNSDKTLKATVEIKEGETSVTTAEFKNTYGAPTGIARIHTAAQIKVHPNPLENDLYIEAAETMTALSLYDISGKLLMKEKLNANTYVLPSAELKPGIYILRIKTLKGYENIKLIKK